MNAVPPIHNAQDDEALAKLLARIRAENLHPFFTAIHRQLPKRYGIKSKGFAFRDSPMEPFCSFFRVKAETRKPDGSGWGLVIEILNADQELVECVLPRSILDGKEREALAILADHGFRLLNSDFRKDVLNIIRSWPEQPRLTGIDLVGWTDDRNGFVLPSGRVLTRNGAKVRFHFTGAKNGKEKGNLDTWKQGVGTLARGNPYMLFAIALAFAGPLRSHAPKSGSVIYHLFGDTTMGKTSTARAALTVWPWIGEGELTWQATDNGLEGEIARANNLLLVLDELPSEPEIEFGKVIYRLVNGIGKGRAGKDGGSQTRQTWKTSVLSTGELSSIDVLKSIGKTRRGGQDVRMLDIPVDAERGAFDDLHGEATPEDFIRLLESHIEESAGAAGAAFVSELLQQKDIKSRLATALKKEAAALQDHLGTEAGDQKTRKARRVLDSFAIVSVAGEWATELNITPWEPGEAAQAVREVARRWYDFAKADLPDDRDGDDDDEAQQEQAIERTREALLRGGEKFIDLSADGSFPVTLDGHLGFQDKDYFYVLSQAFKNMHPKHDVRAMARLLVDAGYLVPSNVENGLQYKTREIGGKRHNAYRIRRTVLES